MKLNNKGFSLVELLAVVVILGILVAFMYPNVNRLINENNEKNYEKLKTTIESAAKIYISDYKYKIVLDGEEITSVNGQEIDESKIPISILVSEGNIKTTKENVIINPQNKEQCLNLEQSYIKVTYNNEGKDFIYGYYESDSEEIKNSKLYLKWDSKKVEDSNGDLVLNRNCLANISLVKYNIHLDDQEATIAGTTKIYGKNPGGIYLDEIYKNLMTDTEYYVTVPQKTGHTFGGYYTEINGSGMQLISSSGNITSDFTSDKYSADVTLYAGWIANNYMVSFDANGGSVSLSTKSVTYAQEYGDLPVPTRAGYTFLGWNTISDGSGETITADSVVTVTSNHSLYAQWERNVVCTPGMLFADCLLEAKTQGFNSSVEGGLNRYQGQVANNYVCFGAGDINSCITNPETRIYRVIGVDSSKMIVKIQKMTSIGEYRWNNDLKSNITWPNTIIYSIVNGEKYLNNTVYIPNEWSSKILSYNWKYGDNKSYNVSANQMYTLENNWTNTKSAKIGLMYMHDYYYGLQGGNNCYNNSSICKSSWIHISNNDTNLPADNDNNKYFPSGDWTMSRYGSYSSSTAPYRAYGINGDGSILFYKFYRYYSIRPVFYLMNSVTYQSGLGTLEDPFIIW